MNRNKYKTLYTLVGTIVIVVISTVMILMLSYSYMTTKSKLTKRFEISSQEIINRLSISIAPFISSYSMNEYEKLIVNEMRTQEIYAIIVDDFVTGEVFSKEAYVLGKIRNRNWEVIDLYETYSFSNYILKESDILSDNKQVGKIKIYYTDKFLNEELNNLIKSFIFILLAVTLVLISILFLALNRYVLRPIENIIDDLAKKDEDGIPKQLYIQDATREVYILSSVINNMIKRVRNSQEKINELNERYTLTLDAVKDGIWDWDILTDKTYFSKRWKSMLGYDESDIKNEGKVFFELIHKLDKKKSQIAIKKHFENPIKNPFNIEIRLKCKDGSYKWILSRGKVLLDENGKPYRMLGYHSDITQEKENEEHKKQQEKTFAEQAKLASMGEMIGNIAHQWRQPLSVISTGATGLKIGKEFDTLNDEEFLEICDAINNNAQYLSKTIDDFRDFIKGDRKKIKFKLQDNINSFLHLVEGAIKNNNINLVKDIRDDIFIEGYSNELIQCYINIFNNAKDALKNIDNERFIFISTKVSNNEIHITFKDNAGGIPSDILPHIFEPYFTTKHKSQGTGLGLSMTYSLIVEGMDGHINVKNVNYEYEQKEYVGVEFTISLPNK